MDDEQLVTDEDQGDEFEEVARYVLDAVDRGAVLERRSILSTLVDVSRKSRSSLLA